MDFKEWVELDEAANLMAGFKSWYNYNRGDWSEVEAAAQKNPAVRMLLNRIEANLPSLDKAGAWGDQLESMVEKSFPYHSKRKARDQWEKDKFQGMGFRTSSDATPMAPTRTMGNASPEQDLGYRLRQDVPQKNTGDTHLDKIVDDHERRLKNLETFLKGRQHAVAPRDATATYHR